MNAERMTSLLRKFVAVRQRSRSPGKQPRPPSFGQPAAFNPAEHEFEHWESTSAARPPPPPQRLPPQIRTQYVDEDLELQNLTSFQHPYSGNYWHSGTLPAHRSSSNLAELPQTAPPAQNGALLQPPSHGNSSTEYVNMNNALHPSRSRESVPEFGRAPHDFGRAPPEFGRAPPEFGRAPPEFGRASSRLQLNEPDLSLPRGSEAALLLPRLRSESPLKSPKEQSSGLSTALRTRTGPRSRSKSPKKRPPAAARPAVKHTFDYLHSQCRLEGCSASIVVEDARFLVCKHQLAHVSDFFRTLFLNYRALPQTGVRQLSTNEYTIVVSSLKHPPQHVQFQWFVECTIPGPVLREINNEVLETCMRLSKRFGARGLEVRCSRFIRDQLERQAPMTALCWLNWALKHRFDKAVQESCMLVAARLPLSALEKHRNMITEKILADLLAMKLRACFKQSAAVFHTIHKMDHFHVEVEKCPRCSRQRDQGRVRLLANPCQKQIGCERCLKDLECEYSKKEDLQAFYQCQHGLLPFGEDTEDCQCQQKLYQRRPMDISQPPSEIPDFDGEATSHIV